MSATPARALAGLLLAAAAAVATSAGAVSHNEMSAPAARAELRDARGAQVGTVEFHESARGVLARIEVSGLTPGWHGVHYHGVGRCEGPGFQSAGGHTHTGRASVHGLLNSRATDTGDLANVHADANGRVTAEVFSSFVSTRVRPGRQALLDRDGAAFMIHAAADDHRSQPIGGSGDRVACGVIAAVR